MSGFPCAARGRPSPSDLIERMSSRSAQCRWMCGRSGRYKGTGADGPPPHSSNSSLNPRSREVAAMLRALARLGRSACPGMRAGNSDRSARVSGTTAPSEVDRESLAGQLHLFAAIRRSPRWRHVGVRVLDTNARKTPARTSSSTRRSKCSSRDGRLAAQCLSDEHPRFRRQTIPLSFFELDQRPLVQRQRPLVTPSVQHLTL